jgi:nitrite reductase/ring-hydroxylating ferredoxin subunit
MNAVRVAELSELPPGKGKIVAIGEREVHIFNVDGRFHATATRQGRVSHGPADTTHASHGTSFDVNVEDSPARVRADQEHITVRVEGETIWIEVPEV